MSNWSHTFECGIVGSAYDSAGDDFLMGMMGIRSHHFPDIAKFPPRFTVIQEDIEMMLAPENHEKIKQLSRAMIRRGYRSLQWHSHERQATFIRFEWDKPC